MPALAQCEAYGVIYDQHGGAAIETLVTLERVDEATGKPILLDPVITWTDTDGIFRFTLPQNARVFISARATTLWNKDCSHGVQFRVPLAPTGPLAPIVPPSLPPVSFSVQPPLWYGGGVFSIPRSSASQDGYLAAEDYARFDTAGSAAGVASFAMRTGAVVPLVGDYASFYAALGHTHDFSSIYAPVVHTHTRAQITDLGIFSTSQPGLVPQPIAGDAAKFLTGAGTWAVAVGSSAVSSVFMRTGDILAELGDYSAFYAALGHTHDFSSIYAPLSHTHTRSQITDLGVFSTSQPGLVPQPGASDAAKFLTGAGTWIAQAADAITSVFARTGVVVAASGDYAAFYAPLSHTHTRSQVTDLGIFSTSQPGLVPQPSAGDAAKFLTGAGTWATASSSVDLTANYAWTGNHTFSQKIAVGGAIDSNSKFYLVTSGLPQFALQFTNAVDTSVNFQTTAVGASGNGNSASKGRAYITAYGDFVVASFVGIGTEPDYWLQCFDGASPAKRSTYVYGYSADANSFFTCGLGSGTNYFAVTTAGVVQLRSGAYLDLGPQKIIQTAPSGGTLQIQQAEELLTLSTGALTTDTAANLLPANSIILDVSIRITTTVTGSLTSWKVGDSGVADRFIPVTSVYTAGTTAVGLNHWLANRTTAGMGQAQAAAAKVRVTFIGQPTAGAMRITVRYISLTAATS